MRSHSLLAALVALLVVGLGLAGALWFFRPGGPPLISARLSHAAITPNADGDTDVTLFTYALRRPASVSLFFVDSTGNRFFFRDSKAREAGEHSVAFSGVVKPYELPGDGFPGELQARVLQNGVYTWVAEADDGQHPAQQITGTLTIAEADTGLPLLLNLTVSPAVFTPNQDGLSDRVRINVWLDKDVAEGGLRLFLVDADGTRLPIAEDPGAIKLGQRGEHSYDYDAGIDLGIDPPPDGPYTVLAVAEDRLGQRFAVSQTLGITLGGLPRADILLGNVEWSSTSVLLGDTLYFTLTVENYGTAPIRTSGPYSGFVYESMLTNANTIGEFVQSGAWRVGINCDTCESDYPWRWAIGLPADLTVIPDDKGQPQYYLMPGRRATVTGGIVLDRIVPSRRAQDFWAGLIHEDVEIAPINNRVSPKRIEIIER